MDKLDICSIAVMFLGAAFKHQCIIIICKHIKWPYKTPRLDASRGSGSFYIYNVPDERVAAVNTNMAPTIPLQAGENSYNFCISKYTDMDAQVAYIILPASRQL